MGAMDHGKMLKLFGKLMAGIKKCFVCADTRVTSICLLIDGELGNNRTPLLLAFLNMQKSAIIVISS